MGSEQRYTCCLGLITTDTKSNRVNKKGEPKMRETYKVEFYSELLQKVVVKEFRECADAYLFAIKVNGIVIC